MNVYNSPDRFGLEIVGEVSWGDAPYMFDLTVVWRHQATGVLYMADDSGCSCPGWFDRYESVADLTRATKSQIIAHLRRRGAVLSADLVERVRHLPLSA